MFSDEEDDLYVFVCGCIIHRNPPMLKFYPCSDDCVIMDRTLEACADEDIPVWYGMDEEFEDDDWWGA